MEILNSVEELIKSSINLESLKCEVEECLKYAIENEQNNDVKENLYNVLGTDSFYCQFSGISIHILGCGSSSPFLRAKIEIVNTRSNNIVAWYEVEYGINGKIQDDYFDIV